MIVANIYWEIENNQAGTKALYVFKSPTTLWLRHQGLEKESNLPKII